MGMDEGIDSIGGVLCLKILPFAPGARGGRSLAGIFRMNLLLVFLTRKKKSGDHGKDAKE